MASKHVYIANKEWYLMETMDTAWWLELCRQSCSTFPYPTTDTGEGNPCGNQLSTTWDSTFTEKRLKANTDPVTMAGEAMEEEKAFPYLGSAIDKQGGTNADTKERISKERAACIQLKNIWWRTSGAPRIWQYKPRSDSSACSFF